MGCLNHRRGTCRKRKHCSVCPLLFTHLIKQVHLSQGALLVILPGRVNSDRELFHGLRQVSICCSCFSFWWKRLASQRPLWHLLSKSLRVCFRAFLSLWQDVGKLLHCEHCESVCVELLCSWYMPVNSPGAFCTPVQGGVVEAQNGFGRPRLKCV